jgi:hypothetical protein
MTVNISKPAVNVREKLAELDKPTGIAGEAMLRAETPQEQFNLIGAGRRNLLINGAMGISQRGTSFTSVSPAGFTLDRWSYEAGNTSAVLDITQDSDGPTGFTKCLKVDVQTADTSIATNEYAYMQYMVEGTDAAPAGFGGSDGKPVTVSFWHKHTAAGTYCVSLRNRYSGGTDRSIVGEYYQKASDVWEYSTITFPPCPDGTWTTDSTYAGFRLGFTLAMGSIYHATEGVWVSANDLSTANQINTLASNSNNFRITGVQLELGKVATPFEHRSYGEELALCQRYFERISSEGNTRATFAVGFNEDTANARYALQYETKRAAPTVSYFGSLSNFNLYNTNASLGLASMSFTYATVRSVLVYAGSTGTPLVDGGASILSPLTSTEVGFNIDAEL